MITALFDRVTYGCCQGEDADGCCCDPTEGALRAYARGEITTPMTAEQREWCIDEADAAGEGSFSREYLEKRNDGELAADVIDAWCEYVDSHF